MEVTMSVRTQEENRASVARAHERKKANRRRFPRGSRAQQAAEAEVAEVYRVTTPTHIPAGHTAAQEPSPRAVSWERGEERWSPSDRRLLYGY